MNISNYNNFFLKALLSLNLLIILNSCAVFNHQISQQTINLQQRNISSETDLLKIRFFNASSLNSQQVTMIEFDLNKELNTFELYVEAFIKEYQQRKDNQKESFSAKEFSQQVQGEDFEQPYNRFELVDKGLYLAALKMKSLLAEIKQKTQAGVLDFYSEKLQIAQLARAIEQRYTRPVKTDYEILFAPFYVVRQLNSPQVDQSKIVEDISPAFQEKQLITPVQIKNLNLYDFLRFSKNPENCEYYKPKKGFGVHAGFQVKCEGVVYKVKFGNEVYSGPFNSRIYRALGYTVPQINYFDQLSMKYDRRMLIEFNMRMRMLFKLSLVGIKVHEFTNKPNFDPFTFIEAFKMKSGEVIRSQDLKAQLILNPETTEFEKLVFNESIENNIEAILFPRLTLTAKDDDYMGEDVGNWSALDLNYRSLKEVRALMVLSAWVGNYDVRKDNLKVTLYSEKNSSTEPQNLQIKLVIGDAGSGLGKSSFGLSRITSSDINQMAWTVTDTYQNQSGDRMHSVQEDRISMSGLTNVEVNKVFNRIKLSDAHWMLKKICEFSSTQIEEALVTAGLSSAEVVLAREKLLTRRNKMLEDFLAPNDLKNSCAVKTNKKISYDPTRNGLISVYSREQKTLISAPARQQKVEFGEIVQIP